MTQIQIKSAHEIEAMRRAGRIAAGARAFAGRMLTPGITTLEIDKAVYNYIVKHGAKPSFLNYNGYPGSVCVSINDQVIHGIPGQRKIKDGDIVSIDVGAYIDGYHGDCADTFPVGEVSAEAIRLIEATRQSFFEGIKFAAPGHRLYDISHAVQAYAESRGCSVVREYVGHGIGTCMHEAPEVPNFGHSGHGPRLIPGMTLAIEPMINQGGARIRVLDDGWTVITEDGALSAHYENTVLITKNGPEILTVAED